MRFQTSFDIAGHGVGAGAPVFVIAEAGVAHFGDMDLARQLVRMAIDARANCFKTQFFDVETLFANSLSEWSERLRPRNLSLDDARELKEMCDDAGLAFMATAHDESRIPWLEALDVPAVKVGSGERNNPQFLARLSALGKPMIVSTGMYREADVREAIDAVAAAGCNRLALLHCVTAYPTPDTDVNLAAMGRLADMFDGPVGYSDHTPDHLAALAAVARGAKVIEKHITILRDVPNAQDWKVSATPEEAMIGHGRKEPAPSEVAGESWALKSLVAARPLARGAVLVEADLASKRAGGGFAPSRIQELIGRRLTRAVAFDEAIRPGDVEKP
jgi:N-acetylneuraminate synthase/N,N'-diacetyllegionaminate synthase